MCVVPTCCCSPFRQLSSILDGDRIRLIPIGEGEGFNPGNGLESGNREEKEVEDRGLILTVWNCTGSGEWIDFDPGLGICLGLYNKLFDPGCVKTCSPMPHISHMTGESWREGMDEEGIIEFSNFPST